MFEVAKGILLAAFIIFVALPILSTVVIGSIVGIGEYLGEVWDDLKKDGFMGP